LPKNFWDRFIFSDSQQTIHYTQQTGHYTQQTGHYTYTYNTIQNNTLHITVTYRVNIEQLLILFIVIVFYILFRKNAVFLQSLSRLFSAKKNY